MLYIASDHAGYQLKEEIDDYLESLGYKFEDLGAYDLNPQDDYPDFALSLAQKVLQDEDGIGILICGTGQGMCMAANKIKGVRAGLVHDEYTALHAKDHLNANVICLGGKVTDSETAKKLVRIWLEAAYVPEERLERRMGKIEEMENN